MVKALWSIPCTIYIGILVRYGVWPQSSGSLVLKVSGCPSSDCCVVEGCLAVSMEWCRRYNSTSCWVEISFQQEDPQVYVVCWGPIKVQTSNLRSSAAPGLPPATPKSSAHAPSSTVGASIVSTTLVPYSYSGYSYHVPQLMYLKMILLATGRPTPIEAYSYSIFYTSMIKLNASK